MIKNASVLLWLGLAGVGCDKPAPGVPSPYQGVIELDQRTLAFEMAGRVVTLEVARGQEVSAGQRIATIDGPLLAPARAAREAELRLAEAQLALLEGGAKPEDISALQAQVRALQANERTLATSVGRERKLVAEAAAPAAALDELSGRLSAAKAQREAAQHQLAGVKSGARDAEFEAAKARIAAAKAAIALEDQRQTLLTLVAPVAGTIMEVIADPGEVVGPGTPVVTLGDVAHPYADVFVAIDVVSGLRVGEAAKVLIDGMAPIAATIEHISETTEFTPRYVFSREERQHLMVRVRLRIADPERHVHPGLPAFAVFEAHAKVAQ